MAKVLTGELPDELSCHIEIRSGGPIESICGDRHLFCILSWLFPDDGKFLDVRFEGATVRPRAQAGGRAGHFSTRAYFLRTGLECNLCWGPRPGRLQRARTSALERGPTSTIELGDGREEIHGWLQSSPLPFSLHAAALLSWAPFGGLRTTGPAEIEAGEMCALGGSECVVQKDGMMLGVSAERGGCPTLRLFFGRHLKNKHLASVCPSALMLSRLRRGSLAYLSVGAGSYFALLTWRSVGEEAGWKLRSRANSNVQGIVSCQSGFRNRGDPGTSVWRAACSRNSSRGRGRCGG